MTTLYEAGDAIEGKKIACEFTDWAGKVRKGHRTGQHRGMMTTLDDAYCIIERQLEWVKPK